MGGCMKNSLSRAILAAFLGAYFCVSLKAHELGGHTGSFKNASVQYLGNEALLFADGDHKVLFDPFFHNDYGSYQLVPDDIRKSIFAGQAPFDKVDAIVVSHAHGDHFAADDVANYLATYPQTILIAPGQATEKVLAENAALAGQLVSIELEFGDKPVTNSVGDGAAVLTVESVRIAHAGWPQRKDVANLVHRVTLPSGKTIMHMGDADPNDSHFSPFVEHWNARQSDAAFPPYWFFISPEGPMILKSRINALKSVGVHVPTTVPAELKQSGGDYFSSPGELRELD